MVQVQVIGRDIQTDTSMQTIRKQHYFGPRKSKIDIPPKPKTRNWTFLRFLLIYFLYTTVGRDKVQPNRGTNGRAIYKETKKKSKRRNLNLQGDKFATGERSAECYKFHCWKGSVG